MCTRSADRVPVHVEDAPALHSHIHKQDGLLLVAVFGPQQPLALQQLLPRGPFPLQLPRHQLSNLAQDRRPIMVRTLRLLVQGAAARTHPAQ